MCADTYIAFRPPTGSQKDHIPVLEELDHYSLSYGTIFIVKMLHFWPKVKHRSTLYDRPSLRRRQKVPPRKNSAEFAFETYAGVKL